jgi:hypothetical protein
MNTAQPSPRSRRKERTFILLSLLIGLLLALGAAEIILRIVFPQFGYGYPRGQFLPDADVGYRYKPNFTGGYLTKQEFSTSVWTNSLGFRDREREMAKAPDTYRILSIGDSFTWGAYGVEADETFSAILEKMLNTTYPERSFEVLNMGVFGYGTDNELRFYRKEGVKYAPDCVLVNFFIGNDFYDNMEWGEVSVVDGDLVHTDAVPEKMFSIKHLRAFLLKHFYVATFIERSLFKIPIVKRLLDNLSRGQEAQHVYGGDLLEGLIGRQGNPTWNLMIEKTSALIQEFHREVRRNETPFVLIIIPTVYQVKDDIRAEIIVNYNTDLESLTKAQRELKALGEREGFPIIDLLPVFRDEYHQDRPVYWRFNPHFNHHGNRVTAEVILKHLTEGGYIDVK